MTWAGPRCKLDERDQLQARLGGGAARIIIDTGSGGVDITRTLARAREAS